MPKQVGTLGQLLVNSVLPEELRNPSRVIDKKSLSALLSEVAKKYPEQYRDVSFKLGQIGRKAAFTSGGNSFGLKHLKRANVAIAKRKEIQAKLDAILDDDSLDDKKREEAVIKLVGDMMSQQQDEIFNESMSESNPLAAQLIGAGRGNKMNLASLRGSDGLYQDHRDRIIPVPVMRSYSQGLSPMEYWAGTYGARQGVMAVKFATQDAGFFGKQLGQIAHRMLVVGDDEETPSSTLRGLPVDTDDDDSEGALLAADVAGYKRNTVITPKVLADIRKTGTKRILVRSPAVSGAPDGGLYAKDVGVREFNKLPLRGENIGFNAVQSLSEPLSQSQLCLAAGTLVRMADGATKPIEAINTNDVVLGSDRLGRTFPVSVVNTYSNGPKPCVITKFESANDLDNVELCSTPDHKILVTFELTNTVNAVLPISDDNAYIAVCVDFNDTNTDKPARRVRRVSSVTAGVVNTYDIEVGHPDHLFVLANGLVVSNSAKHTGGVAGASKAVSGFDYINQLVQVPKTFKGGAAHANVDGIVQAVVPAPAGGHFVTVDGTKHYVGAGYNVTVNKGDRVEAGDVISEGEPNPAIITHHKGIGEGRRYFIKAFQNAMKSANLKAHRRNVEVLARGLINHVRLTDEVGDNVPDDIVPYSMLEASYKPRNGFKALPPKAAVGRYLERPYLHYTIGTKIKPSMLKDFDDFNISNVEVHDEPPPFEPEMVRGMSNLHHDPDFMTRMFGSGLKGSLLDAVHRGGTSSETGTSFVAGRARAVDFGRVGKVITPKETF